MLVEVKITGMTIDPFTGMPIVILKDLQEREVVTIWIGMIEASAIATELEHIKLSRPMTHDLINTILSKLGAKVVKVSVVDLVDNIFYARISVEHNGKEIEFDARPSDAMAVALRAKAPIFVETTVIEKLKKENRYEGLEKDAEKHRWAEILENLSPEDFGKYKM
jgi:bifunctional DNase/RNase